MKVKLFLQEVHLFPFIKYLLFNAKRLRRRAFFIDQRITRTYFRQNRIRKLHIGCGSHLLTGWLNSDFDPPLDTTLHLDATKKFPFSSQQFDYIFTEHMIEHISYESAVDMLKECFRVLNNQGVIRIATPDFSVLHHFYHNAPTKLQTEYLAWHHHQYTKWAVSSEPLFFINNFMRDWGHQFIYDEKVLRTVMESVGFKEVNRVNLQESDHIALSGLENEGRMPDGYLKIETLVMEGTKCL